MLRLLCLVACFFFANVVAADNKYIRVVGEGSTVEQAKENAFRTAVQQRAGAIVLSERQASNDKLIKDNISLFSAGYVDDFKIIDINQNGSNIRITLEVLVADSKLFNQVLNTGQTKQGINGDQAGTALSTFLDQKQKGDKMLDAVLSTYPQNAFIIEQKPYVLSVDSNRNAIITIPYSLKWNYDYIVSMKEAMQLIEDKVDLVTWINQLYLQSTAWLLSLKIKLIEDKVDLVTWINLAPSNVVILAKDPKDFLIGSRTVYKFNDIHMLNKIKNAMRGENEVSILLEISDNSGQLLWHGCFIPNSVNGRKKSFYGIGDPRVLTIYGNEFEKDTLNVIIDPAHNYVVQRASKIEVSIVPDKKCHW